MRNGMAAVVVASMILTGGPATADASVRQLEPPWIELRDAPVDLLVSDGMGTYTDKPGNGVFFDEADPDAEDRFHMFKSGKRTARVVTSRGIILCDHSFAVRVTSGTAPGWYELLSAAAVPAAVVGTATVSCVSRASSLRVAVDFPGGMDVGAPGEASGMECFSIAHDPLSGWSFNSDGACLAQVSMRDDQTGVVQSTVGQAPMEIRAGDPVR